MPDSTGFFRAPNIAVCGRAPDPEAAGLNLALHTSGVLGRLVADPDLAACRTPMTATDASRRLLLYREVWPQLGISARHWR